MCRVHRINRAGVVNVLVATAPLLAPQPHAVLLTSFMASVGTLPLHKDTEAFYKKQLCMTSQAAALLLGIHRTLYHNSFRLPLVGSLSLRSRVGRFLHLHILVYYT